VAGLEAWVTYGDGHTSEVPANAKGSALMMTSPRRDYHARIVTYYHAS
jgi:hypothetical protein